MLVYAVRWEDEVAIEESSVGESEAAGPVFRVAVKSRRDMKNRRRRRRVRAPRISRPLRTPRMCRLRRNSGPVKFEPASVGDVPTAEAVTKGSTCGFLTEFAAGSRTSCLQTGHSRLCFKSH